MTGRALWRPLAVLGRSLPLLRNLNLIGVAVLCEFQYDWVVGRYEPTNSQEGKMKLVDTIKCVVCGQTEYKLSVGKSARVHAGVCKEHERMFDYAAKENESASESAGVPKGNARKA